MNNRGAFDALKACLLSAPILGFPTEEDRFVLDTDASLFAIGGVLSQSRIITETLMYHSPRDVGSSGHVHTFPFVPTGKPVHTEDGPQLPLVVTEV